MQSSGATVLISCVCSLSAILGGCGTLDLQATTIGQISSDQPARGSGFTVDNGQLQDPCGKSVILRGVNEMVTFIPGKSGAAAFDQISQTHANSVRIYWLTNDSATNLDNLLKDAEARHLLPIVYVFNPGDNQQIVPTSLMDAVEYWTSHDKVQVINQHQDWLIIALREKGDMSADGWASRYDQAITAMRNAGIKVPLAIDAPSSSADAQMRTLLELGDARIKADYPARNVLLNVNVGAEGDSGTALVDAMNSMTGPDSPLPVPVIIGEISGFTHRSKYECGEPFDYEPVLAAAQAKRIGWLGWSWGFSGNQYCDKLDMARNGIFGSWTDYLWGEEMAVTSPDSIQRTAEPIKYTPGTSCQ